MDPDLLQAVECGNLARVEWLTRDSAKSTPAVLIEALHVASASNQAEIIQFLLGKRLVQHRLESNDGKKHGEDDDESSFDYDEEEINAGFHVDSTDGDNRTALHKACLHGHTETVRVLLEHGARADLRSLNFVCWNGLHFAASANHVQVMELLLQHNGTELLLLDNESTAAARNRETPVHVAFSSGSLEAAKFLLEQISVEARPCFLNKPCCRDDGNTVLHEAVLDSYSVQLVEVLLDAGADPNQTNFRGISPFMAAAELGKEDLCKAMHATGVVNVCLTEPYGGSALHRAAERGHVGILDMIISCGGDVNDDRRYSGRTPLMASAGAGHLDLVRRLVEAYKADVNATTDESGETALHVAVRAQRMDIVEFLLQQGANVNPPIRATLGCSPLHSSINHFSSHAMVALLLRFGANVNAPTRMGDTCLHLVADCFFLSSQDRLSLLRLLVEHGANVNAATKYTGKRPLHVFHTAEACRFLLDSGALVDATDQQGYTALHMVAKRGNVEQIQLLLEHGADIESSGAMGYTPLHVATSAGQEEAVVCLLQAMQKQQQEHRQGHAHVNARSDLGLTPLHLSVLNGHMACFQQLLQQGANVNMADSRGRTPLHIACERARFNMMMQIVNANSVNINLQDANGNTGLVIAALRKHTDMVEVLLRRTFL